MKKYLLPLSSFTDKQLIRFNSIAFVVGSAISIAMKGMFTSTIDLHFRSSINPWATFLENAICVLVLAIFLFTAGYFVNKKTRIFDALNLALYVRIPYYIITLTNCTGIFSDINPENIQDLTNPNNSQQMIALGISSLLMIVLMFIKFYILYKGFTTMTNAKKITDYLLLIVGFVLSIVASSFIIHYI